MKKQKIEETPIVRENWHSIETKTIFQRLKTREDGLTSAEAQELLIKNGTNELPAKKKKSFFSLCLSELINPIVILLIVATVFSFVIGDIVEAFAIIAIILTDLIMGVSQEMKAEKDALSLQSMIKVKVKVLRDGETKEIEAKHLVVGDIVLVESGNKISADMRIIDSYNLSVNESILTGESINSEKKAEVLKPNVHLGDKTNMLFAGTSVITGRAKCVVVETGLCTEMGVISHSLNSQQETPTPLEIRMKKFSKQVTLLVSIVAVIIFALLYIQGKDFNIIFLSVVALAVSAIPEGLPLAVTMALTIGTNRMGKKNVVVKTLNAVESLGSCTVIATDKTGTLTLNEQTAKKIVLPNGMEFDVSGSGYNDDGEVLPIAEANINYAFNIAKLGALNNEGVLKKKESGGFTVIGDSIDVAFLALGKKMKVKTNEVKILKLIPYESENKYSAVYFWEENEVRCSIKGSVEKTISFCSKMKIGDKLVELDADLIQKQNEVLAKAGYRIIALAEKVVTTKSAYTVENLNDMVFLGLVAFIDPIRNESKEAIKKCHLAGIKVVMITGDHPLTALKIAKELEIANDKENLATGLEVAEKRAQSDAVFDAFIKSKTVFSRVTPTQKLDIVESLKRQGEFVAVTGDGVNDAPAIKSANIGIAMGSGTDVAKETADMIIVDDNFNSIVEGIKEGRNAYSNIRKVSYFLLSGAIAEIFFYLGSVLLDMETPLLAIQLIWLNVITDGFQDVGLSFEKAEDKIMLEKPRPAKESLFDKTLLSEVLISGLFMGVLVLGTWIYLIDFKAISTIFARSCVMALMVFLQNMQTFNCRSEKVSIFKSKFFNNPFLFITIMIAFILQILIMEIDSFANVFSLVSVPIWILGLLLLVSSFMLVVMEIYKLFYRKSLKRKQLQK